MALTPQQEAFCISIVAGKNSSEAYREHYRWENMQPATVNRRAKDLMDNGKIRARIDELRQPAREAAGITLESHLRELEELRNLAKASEQWAAAISAEEKRGKVSGLYVERKEVSGTLTIAALLDEIDS